MKPLLLNLDDIRDPGQPWQADLDREELDDVLLADPPTEFHADGQAHVRAKLTKMGRKVLVQARFTVPLRGECKRCLKPLHLDEPVDLTLTYVPAGASAVPAAGRKPRERPAPETQPGKLKTREAEASFDPALADEEAYSGKSIDLAPALREQILLAVPPSPLCSDDCLGLCPACGADLNGGDCGHARRPLDPRWEALKKLKLEPKHD